MYIAKGSSNQVSNSPTKSAHEYGHSLGHMQHEPYGQKINGQPNIFSTIHNPVDAPYTLNPSLGATQMSMVNGKTEGKSVINPLNINTRKVLQKDIDYLNLNKLSFKNGKANLGALNNRLFTKEGDEK